MILPRRLIAVVLVIASSVLIPSYCTSVRIFGNTRRPVVNVGVFFMYFYNWESGRDGYGVGSERCEQQSDKASAYEGRL